MRSGSRLRINAQLVQIAGDVPLWAGRFDRELKDVFVIQDEISRAIVNKLRLTLGRGQRRYETNLEAYELYLKGHALAVRRNTSNAQKAAELFEQVIASDPAFAPAYAGLVDAYAFMSMEIQGIPSEGLRAVAHAAGGREGASKSIRCWPRRTPPWVCCTRASATGRSAEDLSSEPSSSTQLSRGPAPTM